MAQSTTVRQLVKGETYIDTDNNNQAVIYTRLKATTNLGEACKVTTSR